MAPPRGRLTLDVALRHASDADDALARRFALGAPADVAATGSTANPCKSEPFPSQQMRLWPRLER